MKKMKFKDYSKEVDKIIATGKPVHEQFMDLMGLLDVSFVDTTVNEKKSIPDYISECCHAPVIAVSGILDTDTFHFECLKCRKACNPIKRPKKHDKSVQDKPTIMSRGGSQTKRKRDATTGSTVKVHHLDWRDKYLDKFHTTPHKGIEEFITELLTTQRQEIVEEIMKLEIGEFEGWDLAKKFNCCPGDDMADAYNQALKDVIKSLKQK